MARPARCTSSALSNSAHNAYHTTLAARVLAQWRLEKRSLPSVVVMSLVKAGWDSWRYHEGGSDIHCVDCRCLTGTRRSHSVSLRRGGVLIVRRFDEPPMQQGTTACDQHRPAADCGRLGLTCTPSPHVTVPFTLTKRYSEFPRTWCLPIALSPPRPLAPLPLDLHGLIPRHFSTQASPPGQVAPP